MRTSRLQNILFCACLFLTLLSCGKPSVKVALITNGDILQKEEVDSLKQLLAGQVNNVISSEISIDDLSGLTQYDIVWYHRPDSSIISQKEISIGDLIKAYISNGGKLILSMEAPRLLNNWGIETEPIKSKYYDAVDNGFGRKAGFHGYRQHPIFDHLFGGAYTWHGKVDNRCRVTGFLGKESFPKAENSNVIGILWEYIYYRPDDKILWTTDYGNGKILSIGGFLYYSKENFHKSTLNQFTTNVVNYMSGKHSDTQEMYWKNREVKVVADSEKYTSVVLQSPKAWNIPDTEYKLTRPAENHYFDIPSRRSMLVGFETGGIDEIWTHPIMSLRDYRVHISMKGDNKLILLSEYKPLFEIRPNAAIRTYNIGELTLKEIITSEVDKPVSIVHYEWSGAEVDEIILDYKSNLRYMWPYDETSLGSLFYTWSDNLNAFIVRDENKEFSSLIGANIKAKNYTVGQYDGFMYNTDKVEGIATDKHQVAASVAYDVKGINAFDVFMVAGNTGIGDVVNSYQEVLQNPQQVFLSSQKHYDDYMHSVLSITTPDSVFNEGVKWATLSSTQFVVETPGVGQSLMAGYASSRRGWGGGHKISGRPGYAWYFGRDAIWSSYAFNGLGDYETVKNVLKTLIAYQNVDGKIYHELTTSGSVHYDASDATPMFVNLMASYLHYSGDTEFIKENIHAVHKAMNYCFTTDTNGDHLIEIDNVGHGWLEGGPLSGGQTEFYLIGFWNAALKDAAYLSDLVGDSEKKRMYEQEAKIVNEILNKDFWNIKGYYNYAKYKDGTYTDRLILLPSVPVLLGVTDPDKSYETVRRFASNEFSNDWGVRLQGGDYGDPKQGGYFDGNIWPVMTGWISLAEYKTGRYNQGFVHMKGSLLSYKHIALGRTPEVIHGLEYRTTGITSHQCWSETMIIQPMIDGMLGYAPDAIHNTVEIAPRFPAHWDFVKVERLHMAKNLLDIEMNKTKNKQTYVFKSKGNTKVHFKPAFSPGSIIKAVRVNGTNIPYEEIKGKEYVTVACSFDLANKATIEFEYEEGASVIPTIITPVTNQRTSGFCVLKQSFENKTLTIRVEGYANTTYPLEIYLPNGYENITGVSSIEKLKNDTYIAKISFTDAALTKEIKINLK